MTSRLSVGAVYEQEVTAGLTRTQIVQYAGASGDYNRIHTDEAYATTVAGYPSVFAHGMLTMGMTARLLTDAFGSEALLRLGGRFTAQVWPGDRLTARATVVSCEEVSDCHLADLELSTVNQQGVEVFAGYARVGAPAAGSEG